MCIVKHLVEFLDADVLVVLHDSARPYSRIGEIQQFLAGER